MVKSVRQLPCVPHNWGQGTVRVDVLTSTVPDSSIFQHQEYAQGLADGSRHAPAIREYEWTSFNRHTGCISPRSHGKACREISPVHGERLSVPVCVPPVRLGYLPSGIYQVTATSGPVTAAPRYQALCLLRRLAHQSLVSPTGQNSCRFSAAGAPVPLAGLSTSASLTWYPASSSNLSACSSTHAPTPWHPLPKMRVKVQTILDHWRCCPMFTAQDLHRMLSKNPTNFKSTCRDGTQGSIRYQEE